MAGQSLDVLIQNPSFEQGVAGWQFGPGSGIAQSSIGPAAYAGYGSAFSQTLSIAPSELQQIPNSPGYYTEGLYLLKFSVVNYFPSYPGYYTAEVSFGTQELGEASGWGTKSFQEIVLVCPSPAYIVFDQALLDGGPVQGSEKLKLVISTPTGGWTLLFNKFSLTFTSLT